jgi:hypothetical protein
MNAMVTNRGKYLVPDGYFRGNLPTNFYVILFTSATTPTVDTNTVGELTQIAAGNGYTAGGYQLNPDTTDFPTLTEDDTNNRAVLLIKDVSWTASGGSIPATGTARYAALTTDEGTVADRQVLVVWDLDPTGTGVSQADGGRLILRDLAIRVTEC